MPNNRLRQLTYVELDEELPYMVETKPQRVKRNVGDCIITLWKSPRCIVRGDNFDWIAEADRWFTIEVQHQHKYLNLTMSYQGSTLREAWDRAFNNVERGYNAT